MKKLINIFAVIALPPPIHGQSIVNNAVCIEVENRDSISIEKIDISPGRRSKGVIYHLTRMYRVFFAFFILIFAYGKKNKCYFVLESGYGVVYNFILIIAARLIGSDMIIHHHTAFHTVNKSVKFSFLCLLFGNKASHVLLSNKMKYDLSSKYNCGANLIVVSNARFVFDCSLNIDSNKGKNNTIGFISNLCVEKGAVTAINTFRQVKFNCQDSKLIIAGPIVDEVTRLEIENVMADFPGDVSYVGAVSGSKKDDFFKKIDVLIFPTNYIYEAQPLVILEALQYGIPCLSTPLGYIPEMLAGTDWIKSPDSFVVEASLLIEHWFSCLEELNNKKLIAKKIFDNMKINSDKEFNNLMDVFES